MQGTATFLAKADGVLAGLAVADLVSITAFSPALHARRAPFSVRRWSVWLTQVPLQQPILKG